jgi:iron complex transport system substrate-binding protein
MSLAGGSLIIYQPFWQSGVKRGRTADRKEKRENLLQKYLRFKMLLILLTAITLFTGSGLQAGPAASATRKTAGYLKVPDDAGRMIILQRKPRKIVVLSPSFLELLYAVGGTAVGRPNSSAKLDLPQPAWNLPEVGFTYHINVEKVVALQPDLVIAMAGIHDPLVPVLESNKLPVLVLKYKTCDDVFQKITLFGKLAGTPRQAAAMVKNMKARLKRITAQLPGKTTKIAILHATARSVSLELDNSIAGNIAKLLRLQNVAAVSKPGDSEPTLTPYSLEKLVVKDPDLIFVVTMGKTNEIENTMRIEVENNPAWSTLRAVRNQKLFFLPAELFLLNPGLRLPEAAEYMAKLVYPGVYDRAQ